MTLRSQTLSETRLSSLGIGREERLDPNVVLFSVGLALLTAVPLIPDKLQVSAAVSVIILPFVFRNVVQDVRVRLLVVATVLWACGQIISDEINELGINLSMPVNQAVTILALTTILVHFARGDFLKIRLLTLGLTGGLLLAFVVFDRASVGSSQNWKFELNGPTSLALLALTDLAWRRGKRIPSLLALATICALGLWSDSRSLTGMAVLTTIFVLLPRGRSYRDPKTVFAVGAAAVLLGGLGLLFVDSAQSGLLGTRSASQIRDFGANPVSIIVNVRPELYQEFNLFTQRPLTGFGSHPHLSAEEFAKSLKFVQSAGVTNIDGVSNYWLQLDIPGVSAHSMAADSWARAGIMAIPFWILVITLAVWAGTITLNARSSPLAILWTMIILWDTLFSPLAVAGAMTLAAYLALAVVTISSRQRRPSTIAPVG